MLLDCNAVNNPKYAVGEPVWLRIPLVTAARVDTVRLLWSGYAINGLNAYRVDRASDFSLCARQFATNTYLTNCTTLSSTGQVTVVPVGVVADELILELDRRALGASFYGLAEIEVAGATVSLPTATIPGGGDSRLDSDYSILQVADGDSTSAWASGPEAQVEIVLPLAPGTAVSQLNLQWNCQFDADHGQLGPASEFSIRARDATTHAYHDVPFVRHGRTAKGWETNTFGPLGLTNSIVTDQLSIRLTAREPSVDYYSLSEVTLQNGPWPVPLRIPTARTFLGSAPYSVLKAFDGADDTGWVSGTQGMIGAIDVSGSNLKFTHLKMVGFGTKAGAECFAFYVVPSQGPHLDILRFGNVLIEDCVLTEPAPSNTDGLSAVVMVTAPPTSLTNAVVRRCTVSGVRSQFIYSTGFGVQHVENCLVEDCQKGAYYEPDTNNVDTFGQVIIRSNRFLNVNLGVYVQSHPKSQIDSIACLANEIVLTDSLGLGIGACDTCWEGDPGSITNMTVLNNVIRYPSWTPLAVNSAPGLYYSDIHHAVFGNNVVVLGPPNALRVRNFPSGLIRPPKPDCDQLVGAPPGGPSYPISLDTLPPGYRRAWFNNRDLTGALLEVRFSNGGVDGPASQQQSPE
jgi:hypothetical protein